MNKITRLLTAVVALILVGCGSYKPKFLDEVSQDTKPVIEENLEKRFYLIGDAGGAKEGKTTAALSAFETFIANRDTSKDQLIFLGDNIYEKGLPAKGNDEREEAEHRIDVQLDAAKLFKGKTLFIPGNHDWYSDGLKGLKRQEEYIEDALDDNDAFQPENGCPIEKIEITENIELIALDTQWYITDWDKHPTINDECDIKSRKDFFLEIEGELKKNNEKTIIIAMHHPAFTYGLHGGFFNFQKHIFASNNKIPLPGLASLVTLVRSQGGVSPQDRYNNRYNELMKRLITLARDSDRVIFTSGHEHTLQYIENQGIKQIVSGSGAKRAPVNLGKGAKFVSGEQGFAILDVYKDGSSKVHFYDGSQGTAEHLFSTEVHPPRPDYDTSALSNVFEPSRQASVYPKEATEKTSGYTWFWGDHYRNVYGTKIQVPVATLDTLMGGFTIERKGGGHQTRSLRLIDKMGRNFALRAVKKSAVQFLQSVAFKDTYVEDDFRETLTEDVIQDFYTSSHPFAALAVGDLADAVGIYHTNPFLFYMPKHPALGKYNTEYGDELYIIEERPDDGFVDVASFGTPDAIESTADVLENLRKDEKYQMDEPAFIRARLFDMLLGDWDRHQDQWRWARFDRSDDQVIYRPIPRDRDQVFSNYDGALFDVLKAILPATKQFQKYDGDLDDLKWLNLAGVKIDRTFTQRATLQMWLDEALFIEENLTDQVIDRAFEKFPPEVQDQTLESIKTHLKSRRGKLVEAATRYFNKLNELVILTGTDKDDYIRVTRTADKTIVDISRIKDGEVMPPFKSRVVDAKETKEIWIYALDDDDQISVVGTGKTKVLVRIIGGQNNDQYAIENGRGVKIYDHQSKPNTIVSKGGARFHFRDNYRYNIYQYDKYIDGVTTIIPSLGFNPDDGFKVGMQVSSAVKGFKNDPFQVKHSFGANYFFATQGFELQYQGEFTAVFDRWNVIAGARWTTENFTQNFFGFGNETVNLDDDLGLDFNRVKTAIRSARLGAVKDGHYGSRIELTGGVESVEVQGTEGRFIVDAITDPDFFDQRKLFGNLDATFAYAGYDNRAAPSRGMFFRIQGGVTSNLEESSRTFGYVKPSLEFYNSLSRDRRLVLRTQAQGHFNIGDQFEFYQAAVLGAQTGLRGYRTQRFSGESALAFSGDLRYHLTKFKTGLLPLQLGIFGGADVGRVWLDGEDSDIWHNDFGGGLWLNAVDAISGQFGLFSGDDGLRFSFGFGFSI